MSELMIAFSKIMRWIFDDRIRAAMLGPSLWLHVMFALFASGYPSTRTGSE